MQATIDQLKSLRLNGFLTAWREQQTSSTYHDLSFDERFALLVEREYLRRQNLRVERRLKQARLPITAAVEDLDFERPRGLSKTQVLDWSQGQWVHDHLHLLLVGPTGVGNHRAVRGERNFIQLALKDGAHPTQPHHRKRIGSFAGSLQTSGTIVPSQSLHSHQGPKGLFVMGLLVEYGLHLSLGVRTNSGRPIEELLSRQTLIGPVLGRHVLGNGGVVKRHAIAFVHDNALAFVEHFHQVLAEFDVDPTTDKPIGH